MYYNNGGIYTTYAKKPSGYIYRYYVAMVKILKKKLKKNFPHTDKGYKEAEKWIQDQKDKIDDYNRFNITKIIKQ